ncbi:MAG TPA: ribosomal protein S18-alanine N-acetyltransferase [Microbacteriaceae bacterium]|nr:ribosomal protein S18-alanine N-acetyltransferase [Microbacteriaceae bacterium]
MTNLRPLTLEDLDTVFALECELFANDAWSRAAFESEIAAPWTDYLGLLDAEGVVIGYGGVSVPAEGAPADIQTIAIARQAQRRGHGAALLAALGECAVRRGATESLLEVRADNPAAQALYRRFGYRDIAVRPRYYQPDGVDAIIMRAPLPFSEEP